jgi:hypothetical protein
MVGQMHAMYLTNDTKKAIFNISKRAENEPDSKIYTILIIIASALGLVVVLLAALLALTCKRKKEKIKGNMERKTIITGEKKQDPIVSHYFKQIECRDPIISNRALGYYNEKGQYILNK